MATQCIELPVVGGGIGAGVLVSELAALKTILADGVSGTIQLEVSQDDTTYCGVCTLTGVNNEDISTFAATLLRVNATNGGADKVQIMAERSEIRSAALAVPAAGAAGASTDVTKFGSLTSICVNGITQGTITVEASCDNVIWNEAGFPQSFKSTREFQTLAISSRFLRLVGSANLGGTIGAGVMSEEDGASSAISEPRTCLVWRPNGVDGGNVYTVFADAVDAGASIEGCVDIQIDRTGGGPTVTIPAGTYDFLSRITLSGAQNLGGHPSTVECSDGVIFTNLTKIANFFNFTTFLGVGLNTSVITTTAGTANRLILGQAGDRVALDVDAASFANTTPFIDSQGSLNLVIATLSGIGRFGGNLGNQRTVVNIGLNSLLLAIFNTGGFLRIDTVSGPGTVFPFFVRSPLAQGFNPPGTTITDGLYSTVQTLHTGAWNDNGFAHRSPAVMNSKAVVTASGALMYSMFQTVDSTGGAITMTLPLSLRRPGWQTKVVEIAAVPVGTTIAAAAGETVDGGASIALPAGASLVADGVGGWWTV